MTSYELFVYPHSSLFIGGYAQARGGSDGDTAADSEGLLLPGSAVKGALRESALRLVNGAGRGQDVLGELFGSDDNQGKIKMSPLRPEPALTGSQAPAPETSLWTPSVRHHVSLDRFRRQAVPQRLFQNRVTPAGHELAFRGSFQLTEALSEEEWGLLKSAVKITDQIGGGRGRGLGLIDMRLGNAIQPATPEFPQALSGESTIVFELLAVEPLQLGVIKDRSNYVVGKDYLDGSAIRGAVAASLLSALPKEDRQQAGERVFGGDSPALFGDARARDPLAIPAPLTLREPKKGGALRDEALDLCAEALSGQRFTRAFDLRRVDGTVFPDGQDWISLRLKRRTITRTARDQALGRAAEGKLYSTEILDPRPKEEKPRLRFYAPVSGSPEQLKQVHRGMVAGISVGGVRSRGFGAMRLRSVQAPKLRPLAERHQLWVESLKRMGINSAQSTGVLLALGPIAISQHRLQQALEERGLELIAGTARRFSHGGWNSQQKLPRTVYRHYAPGSVFIVRKRNEASILEDLQSLEEEGLGPGRADGWGHVLACHPIHSQCRHSNEENAS